MSLNLGQNTLNLASPANYFSLKHSEILDFYLNDGKLMQKYFSVHEFLVPFIPVRGLFHTS